MTPTPPRPYQAVFLGVVTVAVAVLAVEILQPFLPAIAWAIVLAVGFRAPWLALERRLAPRRGVAAGVMCLLIALLVLVPAGVLGTVLFNEASSAVTRLGAELRGRQITSYADLVALPWVVRPLEWVQVKTGVTPDRLLARVSEAAGAVSAFVAAKSGGFVLGFLEAVFTFLVTIILLFFLLRDGDRMVEALTDLLPVRRAERERIVAALGGMLQSIFRGSLFCSLLQGTTGGIGWAMAGLPSPVLAVGIMAILSLLPIGGTAIVWIPGAIWAWVDGRHGAAIFLFLWGAVVTSFVADNLMRPILIRGSGELNTLIVFLGVFGGISAFGLLGIFIGPMALAVTTMVIAVLRELSRETGGETPRTPM